MAALPSLNVIIDTNIIFTGGPGRYLAHRRFKDAIRDLSKKANLTIHIPAMVFEEVLFQKTSAVSEAYSAIVASGNRIEKTVDTKVIIKHKLSTLVKRVKKQLTADLVDSGFKIINGKLPESIWQTISLNAVRRLSPFDRGDESAYRDSVIVEIAREFARKNRNRPVVFLVGDKNAYSYAAQFETPGLKFFVLPSTEALGALIEQLNAENSKLLKIVRDLADQEFYNRRLESYFIVWGIHDKVIDKISPEYRYRIGWSSPYTISASLLSSLKLNEYPPLQERYQGTEIIEFVPGGKCKFRSRLLYVTHEQSGVSIGGISLTRREFDVAVDWMATVASENIAQAKFHALVILDERRSEVVVQNELASSSVNFISAHMNPLLMSGSALNLDRPATSGIYSPFSMTSISGLYSGSIDSLNSSK